MSKVSMAVGGAALILAAYAGCSAAQTVQAVKSPPIMANFMATAGYLSPEALPDGLLLIPPPPAPGSSAEARDQEASRTALVQRDGPRWKLATRDADLFTPTASGTFACAAGRSISSAATPKLDMLLGRIARDLAASTRSAKARYQRARPFVINGQSMCTPELDSVLRKDSSYPSGHSAIGYGWGLILSELFPTRISQLVSRGRAFGESRRFCNVHWQSDVEEGSVIAGAVVARLHAESAFRADMDAVRAELATVPASAPSADCAAEAAVLAGG